jgi:hypothetical protein
MSSTEDPVQQRQRAPPAGAGTKAEAPPAGAATNAKAPPAGAATNAKAPPAEANARPPPLANAADKPHEGESTTPAPRAYSLAIVAPNISPACNPSQIAQGVEQLLPPPAKVALADDADVVVVVWETADRVSWSEAQALLESKMKGTHGT